MNHPECAPRAGVFRDIHALYDLVERVPGLPLPTVSPSRATFDYRHVVYATDAREAVRCAMGVLVYAFSTRDFILAFAAERTETAGDGTPRYVLDAVLESGLTVTLISRFAQGADVDEREPELAGAA